MTQDMTELGIWLEQAKDEITSLKGQLEDAKTELATRNDLIERMARWIEWIKRYDHYLPLEQSLGVDVMLADYHKWKGE